MTHSETHTLIWTGSYTADSGGHGAGIGAVSANADGTLTWRGTAAKADSPSFVAVHRQLPVVYAVGENAKPSRRTGDAESSASKPSANPGRPAKLPATSR